MSATNESAVRDLLERWAAAVRAKNMSEVLANHSLDFRMFDVPAPFESRGLTAYEEHVEVVLFQPARAGCIRYQMDGGCRRR